MDAPLVLFIQALLSLDNDGNLSKALPCRNRHIKCSGLLERLLNANRIYWKLGRLRDVSSIDCVVQVTLFVRLLLDDDALLSKRSDALLDELYIKCAAILVLLRTKLCLLYVRCSCWSSELARNKEVEGMAVRALDNCASTSRVLNVFE